MKQKNFWLYLILGVQLLIIVTALNNSPMPTIDRCMSLVFVVYLTFISIFGREPMPYKQVTDVGDEYIYFEGYLSFLEDSLRVVRLIIEEQSDAELAIIQLTKALEQLSAVTPPSRYRKRHTKAMKLIEQSITDYR